MPDAPRLQRIPSFARRQGRPLRTHQQRLIDEWLPNLRADTASIQAALDANEGAYRAINLEIGFGGGEHLAAQARMHPDILFIGCEPYLNGVAKLLSVIEREGLANIRIHPDDARLLLDELPAGCIEQVYILFPDPWPKARHHKRRLVSRATLDALVRIQPEGGRLLLVTDHADYSTWMLEQVLAHPHYRWCARRAADWQQPPAQWCETRYQRKTSREGRAPVFIDCVRQ